MGKFTRNGFQLCAERICNVQVKNETARYVCRQRISDLCLYHLFLQLSRAICVFFFFSMCCFFSFLLSSSCSTLHTLTFLNSLNCIFSVSLLHNILKHKIGSKVYLNYIFIIKSRIHFEFVASLSVTHKSQLNRNVCKMFEF